MSEEWRQYRFRVLYDENRDDLWLFCLRRAAGPEEAEEVLAETFTAAWRQLDDIPSGQGARRWLFAVARNHTRTRWRKRSRDRDLLTKLRWGSHDPAAGDPAEVAAGSSDSVLAALATLREPDQEILRLAAWERMSHADIAFILGCSENAAAVRLHRARQRLAAKLERIEE